MTAARRICPKRVGLLGLLALLCLGALPAAAAVYKYVDRGGDVHYTDSLSQVPPEYRSQVRDITDDLDRMEGFRVIPSDPNAAPAPDEEDDSDAAAAFDLGSFGLGGEDAGGGILETFGFGVVLLGLLAIPLLWVVSALVFKLACRIGGEEPPGLGRACGILFAQGLCSSAVGAAVGALGMVMGVDESASIGASIAVSGASSVLGWMANAGILVSMMGYGFGKSLWIGFLHTLLVLVLIGGPIAALVFIGLALA